MHICHFAGYWLILRLQKNIYRSLFLILPSCVAAVSFIHWEDKRISVVDWVENWLEFGVILIWMLDFFVILKNSQSLDRTGWVLRNSLLIKLRVSSRISINGLSIWLNLRISSRRITSDRFILFILQVKFWSFIH